MYFGGIKTVLITGGTGFIGSYLTQRLVNDGLKVHLIIRPNSNAELLKNLKNKLKLYMYDGTTDTMMKIINDSRPDIVIHLASLFKVDHSPIDIEPLINSNILLGLRLVEAMVKNNVYHLINTGTSWQHYKNKGYNPVNLYAATKQAFEDLIKFYVEAADLKVITLKLYDTYGPNDPRNKLFGLLRKVAETGEPLAMSQGEQLIDLVYIDDVVDAYLVAAHRLKTGVVFGHERFRVTSGKAISLRKLVGLYEESNNVKLNIQWGGKPYRPRELMMPSNAEMVLPEWYPHIGLREGIKRIS